MHPMEVRLHELIHQIPGFIVEVFLTKKDRAYVPSGSYSIPPEYDAEREKVVRVIQKNNSTVIVETDRKSNYYGGIREYVVKKQRDAWLIDSVSATLDGKRVKLTLV